MTKSLVSLALGTFTLGIAEFTMMGILGDVASNLDISIAKAGHLISAYALGVAIGAPMLIFLRKWPLKRVLLLLAALIVVGNTAAALSPGYTMLLIARFVSGLPHGAFFGTGAIVCSKLAGQGRGAEAVAVMVGGMTVANVIGVPAATYVTTALSWRIAFAIVAFFGLTAFAGIRVWMPYLQPLPDTGLKGQFRFLKSLAPWLIYAGVFFGQMSVYCYFSYVEPVMTELTGFTMSDMTWIMVLAGTGMVTGNILAGKLADKFGAAKISASIAVVILVIMPCIYFFVNDKIVSLALLFIATACLFGIGGPLQYLIVRFAKGGEMLGGAGIQIAFNVSNAVAAVIGGMAINHGLGLASPALVGIPGAIIAASALFYMVHRYKELSR